MTVNQTGEGRYRLVSRIATGGMGEVWRAEDTVLEREVAVKVLKHEYADDPTFRTRFEAEARHAAALVHPNVASVFDFGEIDEDDGSGTRRPFLVMELVPGQPLSSLLRDAEHLPPDQAGDIVAQAADGLAAAHAHGIVHRDVKPANLLVTPDGQVKITDFGVARAGDGTAITATGQIIGTPHYLSPEQAEGRPASEASDVYALGVVLYECLAGQRPFDRDTPIQVALAHIREPVPPLGEGVPARMRQIVQVALAKRPEERFRDAADLATALRGGAVAGLVAADSPSGAGTVPPAATQVLRFPHGGAVAAPGDEEGHRRGLPAWWPWVAAAAALLVVVLVAAALVGNNAGQPATAKPRKSVSAGGSPSAPATASRRPIRKLGDQVLVREPVYLGRDHDDVTAALKALGLGVWQQEVPASSPDQAAGTVAAVRPHGLVKKGSTVTLSVWEGYQPPHPDHGGGADAGRDHKKPPKEPKGRGKGKGQDH